MQTLLQHPRLMDCRRLFLRDYEVWINIGVHDFEKKGEQRVKINVDLYVPLALSTPQADKLDEVLDYRRVRQIIIDECTAEHVNLLESLIGKLANRLMQLPGVLGVRVKIAKLEIFDDCEVAIRVETGQT